VGVAYSSTGMFPSYNVGCGVIQMSKIKECFTSRFEGGKIVEFDYSQLEVIGLAVLSKDPQLMKDLRDGLDLHCVNTASLYQKDYQ